MQCQDVKNIVKCCLSFFIWKKKPHKKPHVTRPQRVPFHPCCCLASKIYLYFYLKGHCKWVQASTAAGSEVRRCWRPRPRRLRRPTSQAGSARSFHQSPVSQSAVTPSPSHTTLLLGCQEGRVGGSELSAALSSSSSFFLFFFPLKMYSVVSFSCFLKEKSNCSSLPSVCNHLVIPRLPDADHSVAGGNHWRERPKHAIKCWLF